MSELAEERVVRAIVAPGRTVCKPDQSRKAFAGYHPKTGEPMYAPKLIDYGPGQEIELPEDEVLNFRAQGYLIDPGSQPIESSVGPEFDRVVGRGRGGGKNAIGQSGSSSAVGYAG